MVGRRQPPVHSPVRPVALASAIGSALRSDAAAHADVAATLSQRFDATGVALTDSGTSALVMALRLTVADGGTVAFPAYGCIDLAAAALFARVRVRLYDVDPATLSPDLDSVARTVARGVDAVVVVHFYGYPADVPGVARIAAEAGVPVIEDAAQGAGGTLDRVRLGALAPLSILSFGRGKGITGGRGGALLVRGRRLADLAGAMRLGPAPRGWRDVGIAAAQSLLGRPSLYAIPAAIPMLRLGEMVYSPAHEPSSLSKAAGVLVRAALACDEGEVAVRRRNAQAMMGAADDAGGVEPVRVIARGESGYLRAAVRNRDARTILPDLGMTTGYPRTLFEQQELRPQLCPGEGEHSGASELRRTLVTLPTHRFVTAGERDRLGHWLRDSAPRAVSTELREVADAPSLGSSTSSGHHVAHVS